MVSERGFPAWTVILALVVAIGGAALVFGPRLLEVGSGLAGPMTTLVRLDKQVERLNAAMPFTEPSSEVVEPERLAVFLDLRRQLAGPLEAWARTVRNAEAQGKSWQAVKGVLGDLEDLMTYQVELHERLGISPAEARWLDDVIYRHWLPDVERVLATDLATAPAAAAQARRDLGFVADLERRYGSSAATRAMQKRFRERLHHAEDPSRPAVDDLPAATQELLWSRRQEIGELKLANPGEAPLLYRGGHNVTVPLGREE